MITTYVYVSKNKIRASYAYISFISQGYYVTYWLAPRPVLIA